MQSDAVRFFRGVCAVSASARSMGLVPPVFDSQPSEGLDRSIRRRGSDGCVVSVRLRGREWEDVLEDIVEGFVVANALPGDTAREVRPRLRRAGHRVWE